MENLFNNIYIDILYILIICFLSYLIFIARLDLVFRIEFLIILSAHLLLLYTCIITYSASSISHYNRVLFHDLFSFSVKNKLQIHSKLMVNNWCEDLKKKFLELFFYSLRLVSRKWLIIRLDSLLLMMWLLRGKLLNPWVFYFIQKNFLKVIYFWKIFFSDNL